MRLLPRRRKAGPPQSRRCAAVTKAGAQCRLSAVPGPLLCSFHASRTPAAA